MKSASFQISSLSRSQDSRMSVSTVLNFLLVAVTICSGEAAVPGPVIRLVNNQTTGFNGAVPELLSNNVTAQQRSFPGGVGGGSGFLPGFREATLPFVIKQLGLIECAGIDHATGGNFFESIMGKGGDFGGNYLCQPTCGGVCVPTEGLGMAPTSIYYPFGCRCPQQRCDEHGPIITPLIQPIFKVTCARDPTCTCESMGPRGSQVGYICNWINLNTNLPITFLNRPPEGFHPSYSPVRWCSCCPSNVVGGYPPALTG